MRTDKTLLSKNTRQCFGITNRHTTAKHKLITIKADGTVALKIKRSGFTSNKPLTTNNNEISPDVTIISLIESDLYR
jgi:hypothetical protein